MSSSSAGTSAAARAGSKPRIVASNSKPTLNASGGDSSVHRGAGTSAGGGGGGGAPLSVRAPVVSDAEIAEEEAVAKNATSEPAQQEVPGKTDMEHLRQLRRWTDLEALAALLGLIASVVQHEIAWLANTTVGAFGSYCSLDAEPNCDPRLQAQFWPPKELRFEADVARAICSVLALLAVIACYKYYQANLASMKAKNLLPPRATLLGSWLAWPFLLEVLLLAVHPFPWLVSAVPQAPDLYLALSLIPLGRVLLLLRVFRYHSPLNSSNGRFIGALTSVEFSGSFIIKNILKERPVSVLLSALLVLLVVSAYAVRTIESVQCAWDLWRGCPPMSYADAAWLLVITTLTIGYGDVVPATVGGRAVAVVGGLAGTLITAVTVALTTEYLQLSRSESKVISFLGKHKQRQRLRISAANVIQAGWRYSDARRRAIEIGAIIANPVTSTTLGAVPTGAAAVAVGGGTDSAPRAAPTAPTGSTSKRPRPAQLAPEGASAGMWGGAVAPPSADESRTGSKRASAEAAATAIATTIVAPKSPRGRGTVPALPLDSDSKPDGRDAKSVPALVPGSSYRGFAHRSPNEASMLSGLNLHDATESEVDPSGEAAEGSHDPTAAREAANPSAVAPAAALSTPARGPGPDADQPGEGQSPHRTDSGTVNMSALVKAPSVPSRAQQQQQQPATGAASGTAAVAAAAASSTVPGQGRHRRVSATLRRRSRMGRASATGGESGGGRWGKSWLGRWVGGWWDRRQLRSEAWAAEITLYKRIETFRSVRKWVRSTDAHDPTDRQLTLLETIETNVGQLNDDLESISKLIKDAASRVPTGLPANLFLGVGASGSVLAGYPPRSGSPHMLIAQHAPHAANGPYASGELNVSGDGSPMAVNPTGALASALAGQAGNSQHPPHPPHHHHHHQHHHHKAGHVAHAGTSGWHVSAGGSSQGLASEGGPGDRDSTGTDQGGAEDPRRATKRRASLVGHLPTSGEQLPLGDTSMLRAKLGQAPFSSKLSPRPDAGDIMAYGSRAASAGAVVPRRTSAGARPESEGGDLRNGITAQRSNPLPLSGELEASASPMRSVSQARGRRGSAPRVPVTAFGSVRGGTSSPRGELLRSVDKGAGGSPADGLSAFERTVANVERRASYRSSSQQPLIGQVVVGPTGHAFASPGGIWSHHGSLDAASAGTAELDHKLSAPASLDQLPPPEARGGATSTPPSIHAGTGAGLRSELHAIDDNATAPPTSSDRPMHGHVVQQHQSYQRHHHLPPLVGAAHLPAVHAPVAASGFVPGPSLSEVFRSIAALSNTIRELHRAVSSRMDDQDTRISRIEQRLSRIGDASIPSTGSLGAAGAPITTASPSPPTSPRERNPGRSTGPPPPAPPRQGRQSVDVPPATDLAGANGATADLTSPTNAALHLVNPINQAPPHPRKSLQPMTAATIASQQQSLIDEDASAAPTPTPKPEVPTPDTTDDQVPTLPPLTRGGGHSGSSLHAGSSNGAEPDEHALAGLMSSSSGKVRDPLSSERAAVQQLLGGLGASGYASDEGDDSQSARDQPSNQDAPQPAETAPSKDPPQPAETAPSIDAENPDDKVASFYSAARQSIAGSTSSGRSLDHDVDDGRELAAHDDDDLGASPADSTTANNEGVEQQPGDDDTGDSPDALARGSAGSGRNARGSLDDEEAHPLEDVGELGDLPFRPASHQRAAQSGSYQWADAMDTDAHDSANRSGHIPRAPSGLTHATNRRPMRRVPSRARDGTPSAYQDRDPAARAARPTSAAAPSTSMRRIASHGRGAMIVAAGIAADASGQPAGAAARQGLPHTASQRRTSGSEHL